MDKFITPCPLPTAHEREILTIVIEEAAEVQQRATKLLRFGRDEIQPGQPHSNAERLSVELGDLSAIIDMACSAGLANIDIIVAAAHAKRLKLAKYMQTSAQPERCD